MAKYLIALSGGADSVCLLLRLLQRGEVGAAAHCNFHLRGEESDRDERFVRSLCQERGVQLFVSHFDTSAEVSATGESVEMAARRLRYEWFARLLRDNPSFKAVAVGHHIEDNAETLLLNLCRGAGLKGLTGMKEWGRAYGGIPVYRPLLAMTKTDILSYLDQQRQPYVTDSTNADTHYKRNKLRRDVLPLLEELNPAVLQTLSATARRLSEAYGIYCKGLETLKAQCGLQPVSNRPKYRQLSFAQFVALPERRTLLHEVLDGCGFTSAQLDEALQMRVGALVESPSHLLTRTADSLVFGPLPVRPAPVVLTMPHALGETAVTRFGDYEIAATPIYIKDIPSLRCPKNEVLIDAGRVSGALRLRPVEAGDRFRPFGMKGTQLVSDYLTNRRASRLDKMLTFALCDDDGILWLVGERADSRTAITSQTSRVLRLVCSPAQPD